MMTNNKWIFKAIGYFILFDILFSVLFELLWELLFRGFISFGVEYIYTYMPFVAIFALPLSVGIALRGEIQSPSKVKYSSVFIQVATIIMLLFLCILFLAMFLVQ